MASTQITIPKDTWVNISTGATGGTIRLVDSLRPVQLSQSPTIPGAAAAISGELDKVKEYATFYGVPSGEHVWARSRNSAATLVVTDAD